jgi:ABC-type antimicrobial peptide transport system permease subunit
MPSHTPYCRRVQNTRRRHEYSLFTTPRPILLTIFAVPALSLASIGIYGVISHIAGQRTHEIGIRIALGAQRRDMLKVVLGAATALASA